MKSEMTTVLSAISRVIQLDNVTGLSSGHNHNIYLNLSSTSQAIYEKVKREMSLFVLPRVKTSSGMK